MRELSEFIIAIRPVMLSLVRARPDYTLKENHIDSDEMEWRLSREDGEILRSIRMTLTCLPREVELRFVAMKYTLGPVQDSTTGVRVVNTLKSYNKRILVGAADIPIIRTLAQEHIEEGLKVID